MVDTQPQMFHAEKLMANAPMDSNALEGTSNFNKFLNRLFGLYFSVGCK